MGSFRESGQDDFLEGMARNDGDLVESVIGAAVGATYDGRVCVGSTPTRSDPTRPGEPRKDRNVRFNSPGPRHARRWGGLIVALSIVSAAAPTATAQAVKVKPPAPTPVDTKPVSRYIPREGLLFYVESEGLEVHNEAWQKTAAFKMLTETKLGTMFEAMSAQLADKALALYPSSKMSGADLVACVKMAAQKGFAFHLSADPKKEKVVHASLVLRGAYTREHKATFARLIGTMMGASPKLQVVKKGTRTVVIVPRASGTPWAWWTEGNDVVMVVNPDDAELIGDTLDGKVPSAVEHPLRVAAARAESGFVPSLIMFIDPAAAPNWPGVAITDFFKKMGGYLKSVDYRAGFQEDALMTVVRIKASKPRQGFLRVFDQPSFDKTKLPPLPEGLETFAVTSVEPSYLVEALVGLPPQNGVPNPISGMIADLKTNSRIDLQKDVLAHLGPKMAMYTLPPLPSSRAAEGGATAKGAAPVAPSGLPGLNLAGMMGLGGASATLPRGVLIAEVKNPAAFGKALDNLMVAVNKELREEAAQEAEKAAEAAAKPDDPEPTRSKAKRKGSTPSLAPEFKPILGKPSEKIYQLQVPPASPKKLPAGLRPTLRLTGNLFAVATSADAARMALEVKPGDWTVPTDLAAAFDQLPKDLVFLSVNDPRKTTPEMLASLPGTLQTAANTRSPSTRPAPPRLPRSHLPRPPLLAHPACRGRLGIPLPPRVNPVSRDRRAIPLRQAIPRIPQALRDQECRGCQECLAVPPRPTRARQVPRGGIRRCRCCSSTSRPTSFRRPKSCARRCSLRPSPWSPTIRRSASFSVNPSPMSPRRWSGVLPEPWSAEPTGSPASVG